MLFESILTLAALAAPALALSGQATTTRYYDGQEGACGCGSNNALYSWQSGIGNEIYTAAASQAIFDESGSSWCGSGCGQCFEITSTGNAPSGQGAGGDAGQSVIIMVTNLCPNAGNAQWCPSPGSQNAYGFSYHFDLMASSSALNEVFGDNPIVNFNSTTCPGQAASDFATCQCSSGSTTSSSSSTGSNNNAPAPSPSAPSAPATGSGSSSGSSSAGTAAHWAQCGGTGFTGPTECASGFTCQVQNPYYSQCL